jgi:hypothetical protein
MRLMMLELLLGLLITHSGELRVVRMSDPAPDTEFSMMALNVMS